jgi:hypothetical protein
LRDGYQGAAEVRRCSMHWCSFWPYRMASNPFAAPRSEAQVGPLQTQRYGAAQAHKA